MTEATEAAWCDDTLPCARYTEALAERDALIAELEAALVDHNDALRPAQSVAQREGKDTNWRSLRGCFTMTLAEHHDISTHARHNVAARKEKTGWRRTMRKELEPCPFCGTTASHGVVTEGGEANPDFGGHFIQCDNPNCHGCMGLRFACGDDPKPHLAAAWNTRAPTEALTERASMAAEIERLRGLVEELADDLEVEVQDRWGYDERLAHKLKRDMDVIVRARAALATARETNDA
jgi:hypothetical protein